MSTALFTGGNIQEYLADVVTSEDHSFTGQISSFAMENGSRRSDHIIINPDEVSISFEQNNQEEGGSEFGTRAANLLETLKKARQDRELYEVVTRHFAYQNMAIADIQASHSGPFTGRLISTVRFVEFPEVELASVELPESIVQAPVQKTASSQVDSGRIDGEEPNQSTLSSLIN